MSRISLFFILMLFLIYCNVGNATFVDDLLKKHNEFRAIHGSPQLALDPQLTEKAQSIAQDAANKGKFSKAEAGINTYMACATYRRGLNGDEVTEAWYNGVCDDDFSFEKPKSEKASSFTQLVWKDTRFVGVGVSNSTKKDKKGNSCKFVVVEYRPPGNVEEKSSDIQTFIDNVEEGRFDRKYCDNLNRRKKRSTHQVRQKRSFYYRIPARFYIDPLTGQTKAVTPYDSLQASSKSQLPWVQARSYMSPHYMGAVSPEPADSLSGVSYLHVYKPLRKNRAFEFKKDISVGSKRNQVSNNALVVHNILRRIHGAQDMTVDEGMAMEAESVARSNAKNGFLQHSYNLNDQGENLAFRCLPHNQVSKIEDSITDWYKEVCSGKGYDFTNGKPSPNPVILHFTQLVWKGSTMLGCGSAVSTSAWLTCTYFCCRYKEKGNMGGMFLENVKKGSFNRNMCDNIESLINEGASNPQPVDPQPTHPITLKPQAEVPRPTNTSVQPDRDSGSSMITQQVQDERNYQEDSIKIMNKFRELHSTEPLESDPELHEEAKKMAVALVSNKNAWKEMKEKLKNRKEGIYQVSCNPEDQVIPPAESMSNWYREACTKTIDFDLEKLKSLLRAPHFTQMIWKGSKKVGVAYATKMKPKKNSLCTVVVAKFDPPGNTGVKDYAANVNTGSFDKSFCGSIHSIAISAVDAAQPVQPVITQPIVPPTEPIIPQEVTENPSVDKPTEPVSETNPPEHVIVTKPTEPVSVTKPPEPVIVTKPVLVTKPPEVFPEEPEKEPDIEQPTGAPQSESTKEPYPETIETDNQPLTEPLMPGPTKPVEPEPSKPVEPGPAKPVEPEPTKPVEPEPAKPVETLKVPTDNPYEAGKDSEEFEQQALYAHNTFRAIHGVPAMSLDSQMSADATRYAQAIAESGMLKHASKQERKSNGENLAMKCFSGDMKYTGDEAVTAWYDEVCTEGYGFGSSSGSSGTGHFTQVIWKKSLKLGIGVGIGRKRGMRCYYTVGRYNVAGNFMNAYGENVPKGSFDYGKVCPNVKEIGKSGLQKFPNLAGNTTPNGTPPMGGITDENTPAGGTTTGGNPPAGGTTTDGNPLAGGTTTDGNPPAGGTTTDGNPPAGGTTTDGNPPAGGTTTDGNPPAGGTTTDGNTPAGGTTTDENTPAGGTTTDGNPPASGNEANENPPTIDNNKMQPGKDLGQDFNEQALNAHNKFRKLHDAPPMSMDASMTQEAAAYARKIADIGSLVHAGSSDNPKNDGENLAYYCSSDLSSYTGDKPVLAWYNEVCQPGYTFNPAQGFSSGTGHFTQVVWKGSTLLGFGKAESKKNRMTCVYSVGRYRKPGNYGGQFEQNVIKGQFSNYYCNSGKVEEILSSKRNSSPSNSTMSIEKKTSTAPNNNATVADN